MTKALRILRKYLRLTARPFKRLHRNYVALSAMPDRLARLAADFDEYRRETRILYKSLALPPHGVWSGQPPLIPGQPATRAFPFSTGCRQDSFAQPWFHFGPTDFA